MRRAIICALGIGLLYLGFLFTGCGSGGGAVFEIPPFDQDFALAIGDLNGDGKADVAVAETHISAPPPHPGFVLVFLQDPNITGTFSLKATFSVGADPIYITLGDLNGDGKKDIVTASDTVNSISVLFQDPGKPGSFLTAQNYTVGPKPASVAIGDLNRDGKPDIAAAVKGNDSIALLFQDPNNPGSFLPATYLHVPGASSVTITDLNNDGIEDIVCAGNEIEVFLQELGKPGAFPSAAIYPAGVGPASVATGDLNGDGKPDIAAANFGGLNGVNPSISVLLQDPAKPGIFLPAVNYKVGSGAISLAIGDLNGDGKLDLATANFVSNTVSVLLQDPSKPGSYLFANSLRVDGAFFVATGELNGDGYDDLAVVGAHGVLVYFQDPSHPGTFLSPVQVHQV